jgi:hypothetical protein
MHEKSNFGELFGGFSKKMFWEHTRLKYDTFYDLIRVLGASLEPKKKTMS